MQGEDEDLIDAGTIRGSNVEQLLIQLEQAKQDIIREVRMRNDAARDEAEALKNDVAEKLGNISSGLQRVVSCVTSSPRGSRSTGSRSRGTDSKKRAIPEVEDIPYLNTVADKDRCIAPLLRCTVMLTVLSFIHVFRSLGNWASEKTKENMGHCSHLLPHVSGFSLLFFSVPSDESRVRFKSRMGKLWSFLCCHTVVVLLMSSRVQHFDFEDPLTGKRRILDTLYRHGCDRSAGFEKQRVSCPR